MTREEAISAIQLQLGFRTDQTANIILNLKLAQVQLEQEPTLPWFLVGEQYYIRTTVDEQRLILPTGFLQELDQARLVYIPDDDEDETTPVSLYKDDYDLLAETYKEADPAPPEAYALLGQYFRLFPTPDDLYLIKMIFSKQATVLDTNIENSWLLNAPLLLMGVAGGFMATALRDMTAKEIFLDWERRGRTAVFGRNESRDHANRVYQMGGPH